MKGISVVKFIGTSDKKREKADVAFGIWKDRKDDVETLVRKLRKRS